MPEKRQKELLRTPKHRPSRLKKMQKPKQLACRKQATKPLRYLEAKNGKDIQITLGENVHLDRDGVTIKASIDGEVMLVNGKITVEPIKVLDAVNVKTGDIKFVGTVVIKGSVEEGYKVEYLGFVYEDPVVQASVIRQKPFIVVNPTSKPAVCLKHIVGKIEKMEPEYNEGVSSFIKKFLGKKNKY